MNMDDKILDELFRSRLEHFAPEPPPGLWDKVLAGLDTRERKERPIWYWWAAVAAVLLIALTTGILTLNRSPQELPQVAEKPAESPSTTIPSVAITPDIPSLNQTAANTATPLSPADKIIPVSFQTAELTEEAIPEVNTLLSASTRESLSALKMIEGIIRTTFSENRLHHVPLREMKFREADERILIASVAKYPETENEQKTWKVGVQISPYYSSYSADHSSSYARNMTYTGDHSQAELGAGVSVQYKTSEKWRIESGLYYSQTGDKSANSGNLFAAKGDFAADSETAGSYFNTRVNLSDGEMAMNSTAGVIRFSQKPTHAEMVTLPETYSSLNSVMLTPADFFQVFDFMEIPVNVRYRLVDSSFSLEMMGGISTNILVGNNVYMGTGPTRENVGTTGDISAVSFAGNMGLGFNFPLGKNLALSLEPRASYYLNSINKNNEVDFRPWKVGIYTGLNYEF